MNAQRSTNGRDTTQIEFNSGIGAYQTQEAVDAWEPLVAIADEAGGDWPVKARDACKALVDAAEAAEEDQLTSIQLLADIRQVFDDKSKAFLSSTDLVAGLWAIEDSPWSDSGLTKHRLASQLRDYGIKPTRARVSADGFQGCVRPISTPQNIGGQ
jgi:hypothetical protein